MAMGFVASIFHDIPWEAAVAAVSRLLRERQRENGFLVPETDAESSLSLFTPSPTGCQVFLSFSGADVEIAEFADRIYQALVHMGIRVLKDQYELDVGGQLQQELRGVIEHCQISIPILSYDYICSERCQQELTWILWERPRRGGHVVTPIFYHIPSNKPSEMEDLFHGKHSLWADNLRHIRQLKGWDLKDSNQGQVIEHVVAWIAGKLRRESHHPVTDRLVGIEDHIEAITRLLGLDAGGVKVIGIYGTGGIGKTTLVKAAYDLIVDRFENASFLSDLQERSRQPRGLEVLQAQLLADLSTWKGDVTDVDAGSRVLRNRIGMKKVLIVLDGVDDVDQLRALTRPEWLGPGSRIIITGRDIHALRRLGLACDIHEVTQMDPHNAFRLFCKHAFRQDSPPDEFASISWEIAGRIGGHPLSIKVTGSSLYGKTKPAWEATLKRLRKDPLTQVQNKLSMAIDKLNNEDKEMFLDIACFFVGMDVRLAMYMWDDAEHGIRTLQELSLIKIGDDNKLWMPNHLRDLGQKFVRRGGVHEPGWRSRLWGEDALHVIKRNAGTRFVQAICLDYGNGSGQHVIISNQLKHLPNLRFLELADANLCGVPVEHLQCLRWLACHGNALSNIPYFNCPVNLSILDLSKSAVNETWDGWSPNVEARNLKVLNLTCCHQLARTPNFSLFPHIEMLILKDCTALSAIDTTIGLLKKLKYLDLRNCANLEKLPDAIGFLSRLEDLLIDGCPIREIPISEGMRKLRKLSAKSCRLLTQFPQSIELLVGLEELLLDDCESLAELPTSIGQLNSLKTLSLSRSKVSQLPDSFQNLSNLEV